MDTGKKLTGNYNDLKSHHDGITTCAKALMERKNADYTNDSRGSGGCLGNFVKAEDFGICSAEEGVMVRLLDKVSRLTTLIRREARVHDEKLEDTVIDIVNYVIILSFMRSIRNPDSE